MKEMILRKIVEYLVQYLTEELIRKWGKQIKEYLAKGVKALKAQLRAYAKEVFARLRVEAKKTTNTLDDATVDAGELLFDELLGTDDAEEPVAV